MIDFQVYLGPGLKSHGLSSRTSLHASAFDDAICELVKQRSDDRVDLGVGGWKCLATSLTRISPNSAPLRFFHAADFLQQPAAGAFRAFR
jgi:hypothetical protein